MQCVWSRDSGKGESGREGSPRQGRCLALTTGVCRAAENFQESLGKGAILSTGQWYNMTQARRCWQTLTPALSPRGAEDRASEKLAGSLTSEKWGAKTWRTGARRGEENRRPRFPTYAL